ncbi:MAG TPA: hypothetical protein VMZ53_11275 [Kofleriaceae bacterium]|nr:hypothetical protein [Kofleriaceae bacterium]
MRRIVVLALLLIACEPPDEGGNAPDAGTIMVDAKPGQGSGSSCHPTTCLAQGAQCGSIADGCGGELDCGFCDNWSDSCSNNTCVCEPYCGTRDCGDDGCGGSCGTCDANESCSSGHCKYAGGGTSPPAAWHCNAAYWDKGDGCDCDCGALDPDCGQAGQALEGCTGLASPTCDPQGLCTGGGTCNAIPTGPYLTLYLVNGTAPTLSGGTIASGRWVAYDVTHYGGASGYVTGGGDGSAIEISGTSWKRVTRRAGGYPNVDENFTASISGNTITLTRGCPSSSTQTMTFSASATTLTISQYTGGKTVVYKYSKKW